MRTTRLLLASTLVTALMATAVDAAAAAAKPAATPAGAAAKAPAGPAPVEGTDYFRIDSPDPVRGGKVRVVEVFGYGCPICNRFQPMLKAWGGKLPADVEFAYEPAAFGADPEHCWDDFARGFYAAKALGVQAKAHDAIYDEVFVQHRLEPAGCANVPTLWSDFGVDAKTMSARMQAFDIGAKIDAAHDEVVRWGVDGTPTLVVDGTWRVPLTRDGGPTALLRTVDWLIVKQRPLHKGH